jgi:signal transduction histidine kinase
VDVSGARAGTARPTLLRALLDATGDGLLALDEHGAVVEANEAAAVLLGHRRPELAGKPLTALVAPGAAPRLGAALAALDADGAGELEIELLDGGAVRATLRRLPAHAGAFATVRVDRAGDEGAPPRQQQLELFDVFAFFPYAVVALRSDLTVVFANRRAKQLLGETGLAPGLPFAAPWPESGFQEIAERVVRRSAPLGPTQLELLCGRTLRISGAPARGALPALLLVEDVTEQYRQERMNREFVRNAAHQLRTPLAAIASAVEVLQSGAKEVPEDRDRFLAHVELQTGRLARIARALLVLARAQSGEQPPRLDFVELAPLFERLAREMEPEPGVTLETTCPRDVAALAERDLLEETLAILLDNALEHTREGRIELRASHAPDGGGIAIEVSDTGRGILPEHREHVFEPFYRGVAEGNGFGLGLAIAAQAVEAMSGRIAVAPNAGGGTRFTIVLAGPRPRTV